MSEDDVIEMLQEALLNDNPSGDLDIRTFEEACILCGNKGLVLNFSDGSQFQLQLVQSR